MKSHPRVFRKSLGKARSSNASAMTIGVIWICCKKLLMSRASKAVRLGYLAFGKSARGSLGEDRGDGTRVFRISQEDKRARSCKAASARSGYVTLLRHPQPRTIPDGKSDQPPSKHNISSVWSLGQLEPMAFRSESSASFDSS